MSITVLAIVALIELALYGAHRAQRDAQRARIDAVQARIRASRVTVSQPRPWRDSAAPTVWESATGRATDDRRAIVGASPAGAVWNLDPKVTP